MATEAELLVLRHELNILRRQVGRPKLRRRDRILLAAASRVFPKTSWSVFLVTPQTILRWHRELVRRKWTYRNRTQGRPPMSPDIRNLIVRLVKENPRWGYLRIRGELKKLGIFVAASTIRSHPIKGGVGPGSQKDRSHLARVHQSSGTRHRGLRLLHRRDCLATHDLRVLFHPRWLEKDPASKVNYGTELRLGSSAGSKSHPRATERETNRFHASRPRLQVLGRFR